VSPLWHDEVGAYLSPYRLCLVRMQRGVLPQAIAEHEWRFDAAEDHSWSAPLARLEQLLSEEPWRAARTRVVRDDTVKRSESRPQTNGVGWRE